MSAAPDSKGPPIGEVFRDFWRHRPVRPRRGGKVGGVAAAVGNRYGVDPVLLRVAFVVAAFYGGAGVVLYLVGWAVLPREGKAVASRAGESEAGEGGQAALERAPLAVLVVLALLLVPASYSMFDFGGLFGLTLGVAALYLLHRNHYERRLRRSEDGGNESAETPPMASASESPWSAEQPASGSPADAERRTHTWVYPGSESHASSEPGRSEPPAWDPLGTAPFAWDLPEPRQPSPPVTPRSRTRRSVTLVTLAAALMVAGFGLAAGLHPATVGAVVLGILGLGMIAGAFLRGGRGLIGFAIPVALLTAITGLLPAGPWEGVSSIYRKPDSIAEVANNYGASIGSIHVDLRDLPMSDDRQVSTTMRMGLGHVEVQVPRAADVEVSCRSRVGSVQCLGEHRGGTDPRVTTTDTGPDGPGGGLIRLDVTAETGRIEVTRE